ncbi:MAG TPA: MBL fold metallo-hydrolase [Opitutaceae bacterium]|nr:MBL fold metallo-hydrolase [Opitutaceae bacterium]
MVSSPTLRGVTSKTVQLEDELGDVLEKAMHQAGLNEVALAARAGLAAGRIRDAVDYRPDFTVDELRRLALVLGLNEVGFCALGCGRYPQPEIQTLPFSVWPLRMSHGIGVTNAYVVAETGSDRGLLFDTGAGIEALERSWPKEIVHLDAVFLTHVEAEHVGGLCAVVKRFGGISAFVPRAASAPCGRGMGEGEKKIFGALEVTAFNTPGHSAAHNCYLVHVAPELRTNGALLISGDLVFAGSAGGGYFCCRQLQANVRRVLEAVPPGTVIAPGHGPLTTAENELRYNPFVV